MKDEQQKSSADTSNLKGISATQKKYRISGHESFSFRYAWLPKVVRLISHNPSGLSDDDKAMVELGLGKNMVRSARFWAQAAGIVKTARNINTITPLGQAVLGENGHDPYLEDISTLWLLHWNISTDVDSPLLAWDFLFGQWQEPEIVPSVFTKKLLMEASRYEKGLSPVTIEHHVDVLFHTYVPTRGRKGRVQEENLDCPLVELDILQKTGERETLAMKGRHEPIYALCPKDSTDITPELLTYCIADFWSKRYPNENTISLKTVAYGHGGPGRVLGLSEEALRPWIENISVTSLGCFEYSESSHIQQIRKTNKTIPMEKLLKNIYSREATHV